MQAVAEAAGPGIELGPQLRKQQRQLLGILRQIRTVEARGVRHPGTRGDLEQFHMAGGVATAL